MNKKIGATSIVGSGEIVAILAAYQLDILIDHIGPSAGGTVLNEDFQACSGASIYFFTVVNLV